MEDRIFMEENGQKIPPSQICNAKHLWFGFSFASHLEEHNSCWKANYHLKVSPFWEWAIYQLRIKVQKGCSLAWPYSKIFEGHSTFWVRSSSTSRWTSITMRNDHRKWTILVKLKDNRYFQIKCIDFAKNCF